MAGAGVQFVAGAHYEKGGNDEIRGITVDAIMEAVV